VNTTLKTLQENGFKMAIITNKPYQFIEPILEKLELLEYFEFYIGGDSLEQKKPEPEPLFYVCSKLGIEPSKSLMIGDSKNDILAARAAKIDSIAVSYGYNYGEDVKLSQPSHCVDNFEDILEGLL
jgi:phosphoglycolate phosphatase